MTVFAAKNTCVLTVKQSWENVCESSVSFVCKASYCNGSENEAVQPEHRWSERNTVLDLTAATLYCCNQKETLCRLKANEIPLSDHWLNRLKH